MGGPAPNNGYNGDYAGCTVDRNAADYEAAKKIIGDVRLVAVVKFWRLHHPEKLKPSSRRSSSIS
jgi:hypothetical protein